MNFEQISVRPDAVSAPPSAVDFFIDRSFRMLAQMGVIAILAIVVYLLWEIGGKALPGIEKHGLGFLTGSTWDPNRGEFGILAPIWGTLYSSLLAVLIGGFFGITIAIFLTQDFLPPRIAAVFRTIVELLAAIPSVVYGLWGIFVVIPAIRPVAVRAVYQVHAALPKVPILGMGGIRSGRDALEFFAAGASAISVGTSIFNDPSSPMRIQQEIAAELASRGIERLRDMIGIAHKEQA